MLKDSQLDRWEGEQFGDGDDDWGEYQLYAVRKMLFVSSALSARVILFSDVWFYCP